MKHGRKWLLALIIAALAASLCLPLAAADDPFDENGLAIEYEPVAPEDNAGEDGDEAQEEDGESKYRVLESSGMLMVAITLAIGILLGSIKVPLPGGMSFSVGTAGGPLFAGLIIGHFRHIGGISTRVPASTLKVLRELGLCMFLLGAETSAGAGFVNVLKEYGWILFVIGMCITLLPMVLTCIVSRLLLKLDTLTTLGSVCGGMTSTPALGALISASGTEDVAASYAATYPFALVSKVIFSQIIALMW